MSNNAIIVKAKSREEAVSMVSEGVVIAEPDTVVVKALRFLKENVHFQTYTRRIIDEEIALQRNKLQDEQDPVKMYRIQGYISALEWGKNLDRFQKNYQAKVDRNNHGKTEINRTS